MEKVLLVGVAKKGRQGDGHSLEELRRLTETAGGRVVASVQQRLERLRPDLLIGSGKAAEIAAIVRDSGAKTVIFDEELSAAQQKSLEETLGAKILDRTRLILDIFASRARTREGELQVELAQLSYLLPRLTGSWRGFSQQVGGIGTRGPGERKLEYERRHIRRRIETLRRDIERLRKQRGVQRHRRRSVPVPQVALVGYTNVGKSSLLNALTGKEAALADDKLFATLDPTTRRARLPRGGWAVFTDTVGFIQKLPTALIAAFRSTLEEAALADCLVHVLDATAEDLETQKRTVESVLGELSANRLPCVEALNKADLLSVPDLQKLQRRHPEAVPISTRTGRGLGQLLKRIEEALRGRWLLREIDLAASQAGLLADIYACSQVLERSQRGEKLRLKLRITQENWKRLMFYATLAVR